MIDYAKQEFLRDQPVSMTVHVHYGRLRKSGLSVKPISGTYGDFVSVELKQYGPSIFFDRLQDVREFAAELIRQCDRIEQVKPVDPMAGELSVEKVTA